MRDAKAKRLALFVVFSFWIIRLILLSQPVSGATGINEQLNFQARLLNSVGAVVPDGNYNVEFKIYQDGDGALGGGDETLKWTETRTLTNRVTVKNGYFSVMMGSVTAFGASVDWNQSVLWLSWNIGGTADTPTWDGEMNPFKRLGASTYALNAGKLGGLTAQNFVQLAQGMQTDASTTQSSIAINKTGGTANILQLQRGGTDVLLVNNGGQTTIKTTTDSVTGFQIVDADGGTPVFNVDTDNERVGIGTAAPGAKLEVKGIENNASTTFESIIKLSGADGTFGQIYRDNNGTNNYLGIESFQQGVGGTKTPIVLQEFGGNVGIGNTSPTNKLSVAGNADFSGHLAMGANATVDQDYVNYIGSTFPAKAVLNIRETLDPSTLFTLGSDIDITANPSAPSSNILVSSASLGRTASGNAQNFGFIYANLAQAIHHGSGTLTGAIAAAGGVYNTSTGTISLSIGTQGTVQNLSSGILTNAQGGSFSIANSTGTITTAAGIQVKNFNSSTGTITTGYGILLQTPTNNGTFTNNYGLYIQDHSAVGSTNSFNFYSAGANAKNYFAGNVGIGTTAPTNPLHVKVGTDQNLTVSSSASQVRLSALNDDGTANTALRFQANDYHFMNNLAAGEILTILNGGNVGIGNTSPTTARLVVKGSTTDNTAAALNVTDSADSSKLYVRNDGNVGIGTTNPLLNLHILRTSGPATARIETDDTASTSSFTVRAETNAQVSLTQTGTTFTDGGTLTTIPDTAYLLTGSSSNTGGLIIGALNTNASIRFATGGSALANERLRIDSTGNVGIGETNPGAKLDLVQSSATADALEINLTQADDADATDTTSGLDINVTSSSGDADTLYGVNIANITAGTANEYALRIGSGWDQALDINGTLISLAELQTLDGGISLGSETNNDYVASITAGNGLTGNATGEGSTPTIAVVSGNGGIVANADDITLTLQAVLDGASTTTSSGSGLEILAGGLTLLQGCADTQVLAWNETSDVWACTAAGSASTTLDNAYDNDSDKQLDVDNAAGLTFDLTTTGDFIIEDAGTAFLTISDTGAYDYTLDATDNPAYTITNSGSGNVITNLTGTGDFLLQDAGTAFASFLDTGAITFAPTSGQSLTNTIAGAGTLTNTISGSGNMIVNLSSTGDFVIQDAGTTFATFSDIGGITFTPQSTNDFALTLDDDSTVIATGTVTNTGFLYDTNLTLGADADVDTVSALNIDVTSAATGDADVLYGLNIGNLTGADATVLERALRIGSGWDEAIDVNGTLISLAELQALDGGISLGSETNNDYVATITAGNGLTGDATGEGSTPTLAVVSGNGGIVANPDDITLTLTTSGTAGATSSNSGLEILAGGLTLLKGCGDTEILKWNNTTDVWACAADGGGNSFSTIDTPAGTDPVADSSTDTLQLLASGSNLTITGADDPETVTFNIDETVLAGTGLGSSGDALLVNTASGVTTSGDNVVIDQNFNPTWTADHTWTLAGAEDLAVTHDLAGTINVVNITGTPNASANTAYGLYIDQADSANANGFDAGLVIDNSDITGAAIADGILFASAGSGFTDFIDTPSSVFKVDGTGVVTAANITCSSASCISTGEITDLTVTGSDIANDTLDFSKFADGMTLDVATDINLGANAFTIDLDSTGDFSIRDVTTAFATFDDTGGITLAPQTTSDVTLTLDDDSNLIANATVTNTGQLGDINLTLGADADVDTVSALNIDVTSAATGDADVLYGLNVGNLTSADATVLERALRIGSGWDEAIDVNGTLISLAELQALDGGISLGSETNNDYVATITAGNGLTGDATGEGSTPTLAVGAGDGISVAADSVAVRLDTTAADGSTTSSVSGLEFVGGELSLIRGCGAGQVLKWDNTNFDWDCADDTGGTTPDLDAVYDADSDKQLDVDSASGLTFDLTTTGDFILEDAGTAFLTISDTGAYTYTLDATDNPAYTITNSGSGNVITNLAGTGDFLLQDAGTAFASFLDTGAITFAPTSGQSLTNTIAGAGTLTNTISGSGNMITNLSSTGDFVIQNAGTAFATFDDTGGITLAPHTTSDITFTLDGDSHFITNGQIVDTGQLLDINLTLVDDLDVDTVSAINIDVTSGVGVAADILYGLNIGDLTGADGTILERALRIGSGWDEALDVNGTLISLAELQALDGGLSFDEVYDADSDKQLDVDSASGLTFDLTTTGDFILEDAGTAFLTISDTGAYTYTLDATDNPAYTITNSGSGNVITNLAGTGDFLIQDNGTTFASFSDGGLTSLSYTSIGTLNGPALAISTSLEGLSPASYNVIDINITNSGPATISATGIDMSFDADAGTDIGIKINNVGGTFEDVFLITSAGGAITDALDVSNADIVNAINTGDNTILGTTAAIDFTNFDLVGDGSFTWNVASASNGTLNLSSTGRLKVQDNGVDFLTLYENGAYEYNLDSTDNPAYVITNNGAGAVRFNLAGTGDFAIEDNAASILTISDTGAVTFVLDAADDPGYTIANNGAGNVITNLADTGDFVMQDNGSTFLTIDDTGGYDYVLDGTDDPNYSITNNGLGGINTTAAGAGSIFTNLASTGDFFIQDNGTAFATFSDTGGITFAPTGTSDFTFTGDSDSSMILSAGSLLTSNLGIEFTESDTNPGCAAGEYKVYADTSETDLKKCVNGTVTDLDTIGGAPTIMNTSDTSSQAIGTTEVSVASVSYAPSDSNNEIQIWAIMTFDSTSASDNNVSLKIRRTACTTGTQAGITATGFATAATEFINLSAAGVDEPATTSSTTWHACAQGTVSGGNKIAANIIVMEVNRGADLAEIYNTNASDMAAGDVVALDSSLISGVKKTTGAYDKNILGIVSTQPAVLIGGGDRAGLTSAPIALSGRVPVKVNTENGAIKPGDVLTSSSTPGVAMKATTAGTMIGMAMEGYDNTGTGRVMTFVKTGYYTGANLSEILQTSNEQTDGKVALKYLMGRKEQLGQVVDMSEVFTDRVVAGLEIISPKVTADELAVNSISAVNGENVTFNNDVVIDGTLTVDKIRANQIEGLEILTDKISSLSSSQASNSSGEQSEGPGPSATGESSGSVEMGDLAINSATVTLDLNVTGSLFANGGLVVQGPAEFKGDTIFHKLASFVNKVIFKNDVAFEGTPTFNNDTGGFALIPAGQTEVKVKFGQPYAQMPVVTLSIKNGQFIQYAYKDLTADGFTIILQAATGEPVEFAWTALAIDKTLLHQPATAPTPAQ